MTTTLQHCQHRHFICSCAQGCTVYVGIRASRPRGILWRSSCYKAPSPAHHKVITLVGGLALYQCSSPSGSVTYTLNKGIANQGTSCLSSAQPLPAFRKADLFSPLWDTGTSQSCQQLIPQGFLQLTAPRCPRWDPASLSHSLLSKQPSLEATCVSVMMCSELQPGPTRAEAAAAPRD